MTRTIVATILAALTLGAPSPATATVVHDDPAPLPTVRIAGGLSLPVAPSASPLGAFDALVGVQLYSGRTDTFVTPLIGYGYEGGGAGAHLFQLGVDGGAFWSGLAGWSIGARGLIGSVDDAFGGGGRVVAGLELLYGIFRIEAGYEILGAADAATRHDVRVGLGVDVLRILVAPLALAAEEP